MWRRALRPPAAASAPVLVLALACGPDLVAVDGGDDVGTDTGGEPVVIERVEGDRTFVCAHPENGEPICWGALPGRDWIGDDEPASAGRLLPPYPAYDGLEILGEMACGIVDGRVDCWGQSWGLVPLGYGDGSTKLSVSEAVERGGLGFEEAIVELDAATGSDTVEPHYCARGESGAVYCWGAAGPALGYPGLWQVGHDESPAELGPIELGGPARRVELGSSRSCAILEGGELRCWGAAWPDGPASNDIDTPPSELPPLELGGPVVDLALAYSHACAVLEGGELRCWGVSSVGAHGHSSYELAPSPALEPIELGGPVAQVAVDFNHSCARLEDGAVYCWGSGEYGQLGKPWSPICETMIDETLVVHDCELDPSCCIGDDEAPAAYGAVELGGPALDIALHSNGGCALLEGGEVRCWGGVHFLGLGTAEACDWPRACSMGAECCVGDDEVPASVSVVPLF